MKFILIFKTPDVLDQMIPQLDSDEDSLILGQELADKYVQWGEYIRIEFDIDKQTVTVKEYK